MRILARTLLCAIALSPACVDGGDDAAAWPGSEDDQPVPPGHSGSAYDDGPVATPTTAELYARARCSAMTACACEYNPFASTGDCERIVAAGFRHMQAAVGEAALDLPCLWSVLDVLDTAPCGLTTDLVADAIIPACFVYRGTGLSGAPCYANPGALTHADSCAVGFSCELTVDGHRCRDDKAGPPPISPGQPCGAAPLVEASCGDVLYCDPASQSCAPRITIGEPCAAADACEAGAWCSGDTQASAAVCKPLAAPGEACSTASGCAPPVCEGDVCDAGVCAQGECAQPQPLVCLATEI